MSARPSRRFRRPCRTGSRPCARSTATPTATARRSACRTIFGLAFGRRVIWDAPNRADRSIPLGEALHGLWPQALFGLGACLVLALAAPYMLPWASPTIAPLLLAVPFAVLTASPWFGRSLTASGLCAIPRSWAPAEVLRPRRAPPAPDSRACRCRARAVRPRSGFPWGAPVRSPRWPWPRPASPWCWPHENW